MKAGLGHQQRRDANSICSGPSPGPSNASVFQPCSSVVISRLHGSLPSKGAGGGSAAQSASQRSCEVCQKSSRAMLA